MGFYRNGYVLKVKDAEGVTIGYLGHDQEGEASGHVVFISVTGYDHVNVTVYTDEDAAVKDAKDYLKERLPHAKLHPRAFSVELVRYVGL